MKEVKKTKPSKTSVIKVKWIDGMRFVATDNLGHSIVMDTSAQSGGEGSGFSPMQLLLIALGGCTGMDIIHIMRKQRQQVNDLEILVSGKRVEDPPQVYSNIHVEYKIEGEDIKESAVQRAIQLSEDKYCSVGATLRTKADITSSHLIK
ncbi:MAG: OsmC family protein [Candidatus Bathyarchaeota archaeon]|nr:OsmC family protein [Candidatus Bathyarchaeota archaeon]